jgi:hypothetical protein
VNAVVAAAFTGERTLPLREKSNNLVLRKRSILEAAMHFVLRRQLCSPNRIHLMVGDIFIAG